MQPLRKKRFQITLSSHLMLVLALLMAGPTLPLSQGHAEPPAKPSQSQSPVIQDIVVVGNKNFTKAAIIKMSGSKVGDVCNQDTLTSMRSHLFATAYFGGHSKKEADVVKVTSTPITKGKCRVTITVDENDLLKSVTVTDTDPLKKEEVRPLFQLKAGEVYNDKQLLLGALAAQKFYHDKGYIVTIADTKVDKKGVLNIPVVVCRIADIKVVGNQKNTTEAILALLNSKVGAYLNLNTLDKDIQALLDSPLLNLQEVKVADKTVSIGRVEITLTVTEK